MSIQVLMVLVSVLLRTCIKVLSEHIRCTKSLRFFEIKFTALLSLSLPYILYVSVFKVSIKPSPLFSVVIQAS